MKNPVILEPINTHALTEFMKSVASVMLLSNIALLTVILKVRAIGFTIVAGARGFLKHW